MSGKSNFYDGFFIGWNNKLPDGLAWFLSIASTILILLFGWVAFGVSATIDDPGTGGFSGGVRLVGVLRAEPYPVLHVPANPETGTRAQAVLLSGQGKRGVQDRAAPLDGQVVGVSGARLPRGDILMVQVGGRIGLKAIEAIPEEDLPDGGAALARIAAGPAGLSDPQPLGQWRIQGEICDGKCYQGAMRPGVGLAHKACANLCLIGGAPPVLVTEAAIDGHQYFLLADPDGGPLDLAHLQDLTALPVTLEGDVERRDNLLVFKTDLSQAVVR